jgi:hypothetical protein
VEVIDGSGRASQRCSCRGAMIALIEVSAILLCHVLVCDLCVHWTHTSLSEGRLILRSSTCGNAASSAVITYAIDSDIVDHGSIHINIADNCGVHAADGCVVVKAVSAPIAALVAISVVSKTVIHATVEADMRAPIAGMPKVATVTPAPPSRSP